METICNKYVGGWFTGLFMSVFFLFCFSFSGWPFSNHGPWGRQTASAPSWVSPPPRRQAARKHELRSYGPMRWHTWERTGRRWVRRWRQTNNKTSGKFRFLLGVTEFIILILQRSFLHHVPLDSARSDDIDQVNYWQTCADQFVLQRTGKQGQML